MTSERVLKVVCHYRDASLLERVVATFRKLLIDINWIYGRLVDDTGLYEVYLGVRDHHNFLAAVLDLSKTVDIIRVDILDNVDLINLSNREIFNDLMNAHSKTFIVYIPQISSIKCYSWGEECG